MKLKIDLLSDAIPFSGEGLAGIIDSDVNYDKYGLPYIPAKRIKGVLKEAASELVDYGLITKGDFERIFGTPGQQTGTDFKIGDGYLSDYANYHPFLKCNHTLPAFSKEAVLSFFTYTRSQTTMENGVAKENSLRTCRVLKKGLTFLFDIQFDNNFEKILHNICKATRFFGLSRTRGFGNIKVSLIESEKKSAKQTTEIADETSSIGIYVKNLSQLLVSNSLNNQFTEKYIPGSALLGALASMYIQKHDLKKIAHKDDGFYNLFLSGDVKFSNIYPCEKDDYQIKKYYPCPVSVVKDKNKSDKLYDSAYSEDAKLLKDKDIQTKGQPSAFVNLDSDLKKISMETVIEYHHARPDKDRSQGKPNKDSGAFYQYEIIEPNHEFYGQISGNCESLKVISELLNENDFIFLGRSRTAQYGKCEIEVVADTFNDSSSEWSKDEPAVFTLLSDLITRNANGLIVPDVSNFKNMLAERLNIMPDKVEIANSFLKYKQIGGYSAVRNMPKSQIQAFAAGSVLVLLNKSEEVIELPENIQIGERIEEGFGNIKINLHGFSSISLELDSDSKDHIVEENSCPELIKYIFDREYKLKLRKFALERANRFSKAISSSFIGKMQAIIRDCDSFLALTDTINNNFKPPAMDNLKKINDVLFIRFNKNHISIEEDGIKGQKDGLNFKSPIDHKNYPFDKFLPSGKFEDYINSQWYKYYQYYAKNLLNFIKLKQR